MPSTKAEQWTEDLKAGHVDVADLDKLGAVSPQGLIAKLQPAFPLMFLEGRNRDKMEFGLAQRRRGQLYRRCLLLTFEGNRLTSLASLTSLRVRPSPGAPGSRELTSGAGFNVYRDPDGWMIKLLEQRTVTLAKESLRRRGWCLAEGE